jgi:hypothetical protein
VTSTFRFTLDPPSAGWLRVGLLLDAGAVSVVGSQVPRDWLRDLVDATRVFLQAGLTQRVEIFTEPEWWRLSLVEDTDGAWMALSQVLPRGGGTPALTGRVAVAHRAELCVPIWRALRRLQSGFPDAPSPAWTYPFPTEALADLTSVVREAQRP